VDVLLLGRPLAFTSLLNGHGAMRV